MPGARFCSLGAFLFPALPIGHYQLKASQAGFKRGMEEGITLHVNDRLTVNLHLQVGDITQELFPGISATLAEQLEGQHDVGPGIQLHQKARDGAEHHGTGRGTAEQFAMKLNF